MIKKSFKLLSLVLAMIMIIAVVAGCSKEESIENGETASSSGDSDVVATLNGKDITRADVGESLTEAEKSVISQYLVEQSYREFFKDTAPTKEEIDIQLELMKAQVGEESWPLYLEYYGQGSEENYRIQLELSLMQEKEISERAKEVSISDDEIKEVYDKDPNANNFAVMDAIFIDTQENLTKAIEMSNNGSSLEDISKELGIEISKEEHTHFKTESLTWSKDLSTVSIGDIVNTSAASGNYVIGKITALHKGYEDEEVKKLISDNLKNEKAYAELEQEYLEYLKKQNTTIMGEKYDLYTEPSDEAVVED